jgi:mediator of RNA polymerase II transcription subunit 17
MSFTLALQPTPGDNSQQKSIQQLITKINEERGAFRNVTEETLRDEIAKAATGTDNQDVDEEQNAVDPQDIEARRKEVYAARSEMLKFIGYE